MTRFVQKRRGNTVRSLLSVLLLVGTLLLFWWGTDTLRATNEAEQLHAVKDAVARAAVHCYAVEGSYPPSLAELETRYGLLLNHEKYMIDYRCFASNLMPDITVLPR